MVEPNGQRIGGQAGREIGLGLEDLAQPAACVVSSGEMLAKQRGHADFGAISDHLDRID